MCANLKVGTVRVLIVRLGAMGDILHALPAVTALREAHPDWTIGWAIEPRWQALLRASDGSVPRDCGMPLVDHLHLLSARRWSRQPLHPETLRDIRRVRRELRGARYDVCVDLQGAVRSAMVGGWARAERMIGEAKPREALARVLFRERIETSGTHVIEQAVEVLRGVQGDRLVAVSPLLPRDSAAEQWCEVLLQDRLKSPFVLLSPGAGWGAKRWPPERYGQVARELAAIGYGVAVNAGPEELQMAEQLVRASEGSAVLVSPTLGELIALTRRATLAIAGDTGPLHLASALDIPVVAIFGPTDPARNGPFGGEFRVLRHPESRRDHGRYKEPEAGLLTISPEAVLAAALELLKECA